jgi:hypothetical protein
MSTDDIVKNGGIAYVPMDIQAARKRGLKPNEILTDYESGDDLIIVDDELKEHSLKEMINEAVKNLLTTSHTKSSNEHPVVTEKNNGFMDKDTYTSILNMNNILAKVIKLLENNKSNSKVYVKETTEVLAGNENIFAVNASVTRGIDLIKLNDTLEILGKPEKDFVNRYGTTEYRDDLVYIKENEDVMELVYTSNILNKSYSMYIVDGDFYEINKETNLYTSAHVNIIPLYIIRRFNDRRDDVVKKVALQQINQSQIENLIRKLSDDILVNDTSYVDIRTNIKRTLDNIVCYISLNGNENDEVTNGHLSKNIIYKSSPYGKMMVNAIAEGDFITFAKQNDFCLEFMLSGKPSDETILTLVDDNFNEVIKISFKDEYLYINDIKTNKIIDSTEYYFLKFVMNSDKSKMDIYYNELAFANVDIDNYTNVEMLLLNAKNTAIGQIYITSNTSYKNTDCNNDILIGMDNVLSCRDFIIEKEKKFNLTSKFDDMSISVNAQNSDKLVSGDSIKLTFAGDIVDRIPKKFIIYDVLNANTIKVLNHTFKVNDVLVVYKDYTSIRLYFVVKYINGDNIVLDRDIDQRLIHCKINDVNDIVDYLYHEDGPLSNIVKTQNSLTTYIKEDISIKDSFSIDYLEKINKNEIFNSLVSIDNVIVDGADFKKDDVSISLTRDKLPIIVNGVRLSEKDFNNSYYIESDSINITTEIQLKDFISFDNVPFELLKKFMYVSAYASIVSSGNEIVINGESYNRGNVASVYNVDFIDFNDDGIVKLKITSEAAGNKMALESININIRFLCNDMYTLRDSNGTIKEYVMVDNLFNRFIMTNVKDKEIIFKATKKQDNKQLFYYDILAKNDNYSVISDGETGIIKIIDNDGMYYYLHELFTL